MASWSDGPEVGSFDVPRRSLLWPVVRLVVFFSWLSGGVGFLLGAWLL